MRRNPGTTTRPPKDSNLCGHSTVWLFPSFGALAPQQPGRAGARWELTVNGAVFRPRVVKLQKRFLVRLLQRAMQAPPEAFESSLFKERIRPFIGAPHRGRRLHLDIQGCTYHIHRKSKRDGHFRAKVVFETPDLTSEQAANLWLDVSTIRGQAAEPTLGGRIQLLSPTGTSIVSDIDDTIKESGVGCRRTLLANTFLNEFRDVDGMVSLYRAWEQQGAAFHYVSSSPWQLFAPLEQWRVGVGYPEGSFHLRQFRLGQHVLRRLLRIRRQGKARIIQQLIRQFPQRKFLLVGDSSEHDPEIYGALARRYPRQVANVFIRNVDRNPMLAQRSAKAFRSLPPGSWQIFQQGGELPTSLQLPPADTLAPTRPVA
ncbi:MAG: App1 family protein [Planctomycetales bacterium]|nr:App1 family protein [Planctomycetales bacterium]